MTPVAVHISGADVSSSVMAASVSLQLRLNARGGCNFVLKTVTRPPIGAPVQVYEDSVLIWSGIIAKIAESTTYVGAASEVELSIDVVSNEAILDDRVIEVEVYESTNAGAVLADIIATYLPADGFTAGTISDGADITKLIIDHRAVADIIDELARLSDFVWYADENRALHFHTMSVTEAPYSITDADPHVGRITVTRDSTDYANELWRRVNWAAFGQTIETFHGNGATRTWTLAHPPALVDRITLADVDVELGKTGVDTERQYYWSEGSTTITQDAAETLLVLADDLVVYYRELGSDCIYSLDQAQIIARGTVENTSGHHGRVVEDTGNADASGALQANEAELAQLAVVPRVVEFDALDVCPRPGELVTIALTVPSIAGDFVVQEVSARYQTGVGFLYTATATDVSRYGGWQEWLKALTGGAAGSVSVSSSGGGGAPEAPDPVAPTAAAIVVLESGARFTLRTGWTPAFDIGGTVGYEREVRYYSDASGAVPESEWMGVGAAPGAATNQADSGPFPKPPAAQYVGFRVRGVNAVQDVTAWVYAAAPLPQVSAATAGGTPPEAPVSVTCSDHPGERYLDSVALTHSLIYPVATLPGGHHVTAIDWWLAEDGVTWGYIGRQVVGETFSYDVLAPHTTETNWKVRAASVNDYGQSAVVESAAFTVTGLSAITGTGAYAAKDGQIGYALNGDPTRFDPSGTWTNPTDVNLFHSSLWVRHEDQAGDPAPSNIYGDEGNWREVTQGRDAENWTAGKVIHWGEAGWWLPPAGEPSSGFHYFHFRLYSKTRAEADTPSPYAVDDAADIPGTVQQVWNAGGGPNTSYDFRLYVAESQGFDARLAGKGMLVSGGKLKSGIANPANIIVNAGFEDGYLGWDFASASIAGGPYTGTQCAKLLPNGYVYQEGSGVRPGDTLYLEGYYKFDAGSTGNARHALIFVDEAGAFTGGSITPVPASTTAWTKFTVTGVAPAGTSRWYIHLLFDVAPTGAAYVDNVYMSQVVTGNEVALGAGLVAQAGYVAVNPGTSIDVSSGQVGVKVGALTSGFFAAGALGADLTKYSADKKPVGIYYGLPSTADPTVPAVIFNTQDGKLYRNVGGAWNSGVAPGGIVAGTVASGVTITGTVYANKLIENGGGITGCRLTLNLNGVTVAVANQWDASYGAYAGVSVQINGSNNRTIVSYAGIGVIGYFNNRAAEFSAPNSQGYMVLRNLAGGVMVEGFGADGLFQVCTLKTYTSGHAATTTGAPLCIGDYHLWVDASGRLRIKYGKANGDLEGVVVGTQA